MFVKALEQFKCDELTRALCQSLPKIDVFDHFLIVKGAETFWGAPPHLALHFWGASPPNPPCTAILGPPNTM